MTVDNVTQILNKIPRHKWWMVMSGGGLDIPRPLLEEIQRRYSTKNHACADYYVNCHPEAEWKHLTRKLYVHNEFALAKEAKSFMSNGKLFYQEYILLLLCIPIIKILLYLAVVLISEH